VKRSAGETPVGRGSRTSLTCLNEEVFHLNFQRIGQPRQDSQGRAIFTGEDVGQVAAPDPGEIGELVL
jgi:hypothetical protein